MRTHDLIVFQENKLIKFSPYLTLITFKLNNDAARNKNLFVIKQKIFRQYKTKPKKHKNIRPIIN
jgi:hypothetical protein